MKLLLSILAFAAYTDASAQFVGAEIAARYDAQERARAYQQQQREDYLGMQREALSLQREALELQRADRRYEDALQEYRQCVAERSLFCVRPIRF